MENKNWHKILKEKIQPAFLTPQRDYINNNVFKSIIEYTIDKLNALKSESKDNKCFFGAPVNYMKNLDEINNIKDNSKIPTNVGDITLVIEDCCKYINGMFNWCSPKSMINVVPPAAIPSIVGNLIGSILNSNLVEQNPSGNIAALEIEVVSMISKLIGYDPIKSAGHFTFGGTGAYLFATKLAITKLFGKDSRYTGIPQNGQILVSSVGHFASQTCSDWCGIGMNNVRHIEINEDNSMNLNNLEHVMDECFKEGKPIAMIVATIGSTDAFGIDDIKSIVEIRDRYVEKYNIKNKPFIYADAVIGWAWSVFNDYDFTNNPMQFTNTILNSISESYNKIKNIYLADAVGIDFHKTGFTSYNCSMICVKNSKDLAILAREKHDMAYLYQFSSYTPGEYTLECSRSGNYALSAWCSLKYFGKEGYRALIGSLLELQNSIRNVIKSESSIVCVNEQDNGFVTLFRVYPNSLNINSNTSNFAKFQYKNEFNNPDYSDDLVKYNKYQFEVAKELQRILYEENGPALSFTSKFRLNKYNKPIAAIKAYPMSPYIEIASDNIKDNLIKYILQACKNVDCKNIFN